MQNNNNIAPQKEELDLPQYILYIVVLSRVVYSGLFTGMIVYFIAPLMGLPSLPYSTDPTQVILWGTLFTGIGLISIALGFKVWVGLSWLTAAIFSKDLRTAIKNKLSKRDKMK